MEMKFIRIVSFCLVASMAVLILAASAWDYFSGAEERWIYYYANNPGITLEEFSSYEFCEARMNKDKTHHAGCRRVDGPYKLINSVADYLF